MFFFILREFITIVAVYERLFEYRRVEQCIDNNCGLVRALGCSAGNKITNSTVYFLPIGIKG